MQNMKDAIKGLTVTTEENSVDMTVYFASDTQIHYNDVKKAYDLDIWHGNVNPFLHDAELCLKKLYELSENNADLLTEWANDGLIRLTTEGKIDSVNFSVCGAESTFMLKVDGVNINDAEAEVVWKQFLFDNYEAICKWMVMDIYRTYTNWILRSVELYCIEEKGERVLLSVYLDPWMLQSKFDIIESYVGEAELHNFKHDYDGIGFYVFVGEECAHCWRFNKELGYSEEFLVSLPKDLVEVLSRAIALDKKN